MFEEVLFEQKGQLGVITLNRPSALNALTLPMILEMQKQLLLWKEDDAIHAVVLIAAPGKAFCAGGDVRWLYNAGKAHDPQQMQFFWHEYRLNHFIHHLGKPYISLIDGMSMGGGVGVSLHGSHPVASERFVFAMPETTIGFFPDIGASYLLHRCPGSLGIYLALTGQRLGAEEAKKAGLVKYLVASESLPDLFEDLISADLSEQASLRVDRCIERHQSPSKSEALKPFNPLIDVCFSEPTVEGILDALNSSDESWGLEVGNDLLKKSPLSLKVTLAQLQKTKSQYLAECLKTDYKLARHFMQGSDFYEGVRALLVDRDQNPQWQPFSLVLVSESRVQGYFEGSGLELEFISA
ncbi:MAG: enoyl-CoA hydratase/isomerase family protein [Legionellales bacterium]